MEPRHVRWMDTLTLANLRRSLQIENVEAKNKTEFVTYKAKVKLHGTNAAIYITKNNLWCSSRERIITPEDDNYGFARWVDSQKEKWLKVFDTKSDNTVIVVRGEWCGPGIIGKTAISDIPNKIFATFAIQVVKYSNESEVISNIIISDPNAIKEKFKLIPDNVYILPWVNENTFTFDHLSDENNLDEVNKLVDDIDKCDPWVKEQFNVIGCGEGLVFFPDVENLSYEKFERFAFKAKGESHKILNKGKPLELNSQSSETEAEFVKLVLTDERLNQGLRETNSGKNIQDISKFLKWIQADVLKEAKGEIQALPNNTNEKNAMKAVNLFAASWYKNLLK